MIGRIGAIASSVDQVLGSISSRRSPFHPSNEILRLVHQAGIEFVDIAVARHDWDAETFVVDQFGKLGLDPPGDGKPWE